VSGTRIAALLGRLEGELRTLRDGEKFSNKSRISAGNLVFVCTARSIANRYISVVDEMAQRFPSRAFFVAVEGAPSGTRSSADSSTRLDLLAEGAAVRILSAQQLDAQEDEGPRSMMGLAGDSAPPPPLENAADSGMTLDVDGRVYAIETDADGLSDRVDIRGPRAFARHLASAVDALVLPELPVILVWVGAARADDGVFQAFNDDTKRVITDSAYAGLDSLLSIFQWTQEADTRPRLSDLAWVRLGPWQELTARFFDDERSAVLDVLERIEISHAAADTGFQPPDCALFTAWIANRLGATLERDSFGYIATQKNGRRFPISVTPVPRPKGVAPGTLASARFLAKNGEFTAQIKRDLGTGRGDQTADADLLHWHIADGVTVLEQTIRLHSNKVSYWLDRTVRRPDEEPLFVAVLQTLLAMDAAQDRAQESLRG